MHQKPLREVAMEVEEVKGWWSNVDLRRVGAKEALTRLELSNLASKVVPFAAYWGFPGC